MPITVEQVRDQALSLPLIDRAALIDELLASLDQPDPQIDSLWAAEAEERLAAYEAGLMDSILAEDAFVEGDRP